jgi:dihydropyrimidine dehydrogenase (NAD+) subunit PreT
MPPVLLILVSAAVLLAFVLVWHRHGELRRQHAAVRERASMQGRAAAAAPVVLPVIDLARCLGCGTCVRECPEDGVLALVHGQAAVVNAAACVGHARCVSECPAGAVTLGRADEGTRTDVPVLDDELVAIGPDGAPIDGLHLVGEITARSLIRSATQQGARVADRLAARLRSAPPNPDPALHDVVVVGAGPGGFATALGLRRSGLRFVLLDQEDRLGGAVAKYPRHKLVLTDDVELPLHGRLVRREYGKEELITLWQQLAERHDVPFRGGVTFTGVDRRSDGTFDVHTDHGDLHARAVVLAVGRRGTPRRLGVPGEELPHVTYALYDAASYQNGHHVVVGGGDSAIETALALAGQPGNHVTIVYRNEAFFRLRTKNRERLEQALAAGTLEAQLSSEVRTITADHVEIAGTGGGGVAVTLRADHVFVMAGGEPPFALLERCQVSFDPAVRAAFASGPRSSPQQADDDRGPGSGLVLALGAAAAAVLATACFVAWHHDYYFAPAALRAADPQHALLRPDRCLGLWFGIAAAAAVAANLAYLLRRQQLWGMRFGRLTAWMNVHVATGIAAVLLALLHGALAPRPTPGGHAFWGLVALLGTGAIGRWFYAWLPRRTNGRERELDVLRAELEQLRRGRSGSPFALAARTEVVALTEARQWRSTWFGRLLALVGVVRDRRRAERRLAGLAATHGASAAELGAELAVLRSAHRTAIAVAHLEDLRALLSSWRWLHRWLALLTVLLLGVHVVVAVLHGALRGGAGL